MWQEFSNIIKKANLSADKQAVREMNMALAADENLHGRPTDIETVMRVLANAGYNSDNWVCLTQGYEVYWFQEDNRLVLYNASTAEVEYPTEYDAKVMTNAKNHFFLYNENNEKAIKMDITLGSSSGSSTYSTLQSGKGQSIGAYLDSDSANSGTTALSSSQKAALQKINSLLDSSTSAVPNLSSSVLTDEDGTTHNMAYIYAARELTSSTKSTGTYATMQVVAVGGTQEPILKSDGTVEENFFYISTVLDPNATQEQIAQAKIDAGEYVYAVFAKINAGQVVPDAKIVLDTEIDCSSHEWAPVREFNGYFGSTDPTKPIVINGARLTSATGYAATVGFTGSSSKYFVTGFFGTIYGNTTIENVTFRNITFTEPATDYALTTVDKNTGKTNSRNCIGIIGGITDHGQNANCPANIVIKNVIVEDSVSFMAGATAGGLVGYIGGAGENNAVVGNVNIESCTISARLTSNYIAASSAYGPMGGVIGLVCRNNTNITVKNVVFNGSVDGHQDIAGIIGDIQSPGSGAGLKTQSITLISCNTSGATIGAAGYTTRKYGIAHVSATTTGTNPATVYSDTSSSIPEGMNARN